METLILFFGITIGFLSFGLIAAGVALYFLFRQLKTYRKQLIGAYQQISNNKKLEAKNHADTLEFINSANTEYKRWMDLLKRKFDHRNKRFDVRLKLLEKIPVAEHMTLTMQQSVNAEVEKKLAEQLDRGDNILDITRQREIEAYNRQHKK